MMAVSPLVMTEVAESVPLQIVLKSHDIVETSLRVLSSELKQTEEPSVLVFPEGQVSHDKLESPNVGLYWPAGQT
jgi:hypothetical protein